MTVRSSLALLAFLLGAPLGEHHSLQAQATSSAPRLDSISALRAERKRADQEKLLVDWGSLSRYRAANEALGAPANGERRVVFIGDSMIDSWANYFPAMFAGKPYVGRGISGQTTPQMLVRFRQDVVALKPKVVVILGGTNDIAGNTGPSTLEMIEDNLISMVEIAKANGIRVVLASVLPAYRYSWKPDIEPALTIVALNSWIRSYATRVGATYLDFHSAMADDRLGLRADLTPDGVHPNQSGYVVMAALADRAIAKALRLRSK